MRSEERDYADLNREDIAVYNFRGYTVLCFWKQDAPDGMKHSLKFMNGNHCIFIPEDYLLMAEFLSNCHKFCTGEITELNHVRVS